MLLIIITEIYECGELKVADALIREDLDTNNGMSDFTMGTILGKGFAQAQVHTVNSTNSQNCPYAEIRHIF